MTRMVSLGVLLATVGLFGLLSFEVLRAFFLPLFLAVLLVVVFRPLHERSLNACGGRSHWAAGLTTLAICLGVLLPLGLLLMMAARESWALITDLKPETVAQRIDVLLKRLSAWAPEGLDLNARMIVEGIELQWRGMVAPIAAGAKWFVGAFVELLVGLAIMLVAVFYFFADGPALVKATGDLIPLQSEYKGQLLGEFVNLTRAIILSMVLAAFGQGLLAGVGFYFAGLNNVVLLSVLTMMLSMVPFIGSALVWVPCALWLAFYQERLGAALGLSLFCMVIVASADNVIKPWVLVGRSNLHPLLGLLSVLGGVQALGPIGIVVGPMIVAFLQTSLMILNKELLALDTPAVTASQA